MTLLLDLKNIFTVQNSSSTEQLAKEITEVYKKSVEHGFDSILNKYTEINYELLQNAITQQFNLSFDTNSYLNFNIIELALIQSWTSAILIPPGIPAPGLVSNVTATVQTSTLVGTLPLVGTSNNADIIVNKFYSLFKTHAESIIFLYTGITLNGTLLSVPVKSYLIK